MRTDRKGDSTSLLILAMELLLPPLTSLPGAAEGGGEGLFAAEHRALRRALLLQDKATDGFREIGGRKRSEAERETAVGGEGRGRAAIVMELQVCSLALPA